MKQIIMPLLLAIAMSFGIGGMLHENLTASAAAVTTENEIVRLADETTEQETAEETQNGNEFENEINITYNINISITINDDRPSARLAPRPIEPGIIDNNGTNDPNSLLRRGITNDGNNTTLNDGKTVTKDGRTINNNGNADPNDGRTTITKDGRPVKRGRRTVTNDGTTVTKDGRTVTKDGTITTQDDTTEDKTDSDNQNYNMVDGHNRANLNEEGNRKPVPKCPFCV